ncbi:MAG: hypothetical protein AAFY33_08175 [Cyanobacteria bacterium J06643_4]
MALGIIVVVITLWILCTANSSSSSSKRQIYASAAHNTSFKVKVVDRDKQDLNEITHEWENGYFLVFDALDKRKIKNQGKLKVPGKVWHRAHIDDVGVLSVDQEGCFKSFNPTRVPARAA